MKVISEDRKSYIEINFIEAEMIRLPSIHISIFIQNDGFTGTLKSAWLEIEDLNYFMSCLNEIDLKREGKAHINSMSPYDFILDFETYDKSGHIKLQYTLTDVISYPYFRELSLKGGFKIDSSEFTQIIKDFSKLIMN